MSTKSSSHTTFMVKYGPIIHAMRVFHDAPSEVSDKHLYNCDEAITRLAKDAPQHLGLAMDDHVNALTKYANDPHGDPWHLGYLMKRHAEHLHPHHLTKIFNEAPSYNIKHMAVSHPKASQELIRAASEHHYGTVREAAYGHPNAPDDVIIKGLKDDYYDARTTAAGRAYVKGRDWITKNNLDHLL